MNKIRIRINDEVKYVVRTLYRMKIDVYDIEYRSSGNVYTILESDLDKLNEEYYEIVSYKGVKGFIYKLKRHRHFIVSVLLCIGMMFLISNVIVDVDVIHSDKDIRVLVEDELYDLGVKPFVWKKSYKEIQEIKTKIKDNYPNDIEWLEIIDEGMRYTVRVEERIITELESEPDYCNIVSTRDATVLNIVSSKGQTIVEVNDYVKKGATLISGEIKFNDVTRSHTCAEGVVYGNTWYKVNISVPFEHTVKEYTGEEAYNLGVEFGSVYNRIFRVHMDEYDVDKRKIFGLGRFALYKEKVREYKSKREIYSEEEALDRALNEAREKLLIKLDSESEILSEKVLQSSTHDSIISVEIFYSVKEVISERIESEYVEINEEDEELE